MRLITTFEDRIMTGQLSGIATKPASRAPMVLHEIADISVEDGLAGDWRGKQKNRQVTVLFAEDWATICNVSGSRMPWERRRANILISDMRNPRTAGGQLTIGEIILQITGETKPCNRMNQAFPGLKMLLTPAWRGGMTCRVLTGGTIHLGDPVSYQEGPGR